ncbi:MAG: response regulator [Amphibacillus sp.]|uniref:Putative response regulator n=1 Tax=Amphibacillus xylanus (strain ATCC 51415 / DSM 6626 / JCM 7361 / LMG 17667 / NBRC 15112 / Ep01) TaxID=698758 RepID=K0J2X0_AMPXN|nr:response regulator [Amphibacillus xylanus]NMA90586.1 response regulator [Amphibacillus sp.]BAM46926.1 putative response regulator [Amphibacillus xylanus NBRC 15112]
MARILITDDAAFMRMQLRNIFESLGHEIVGEAENGQVAIDLYKELMPDLVTMDITMPEMNGVEAVKGIKSFDPNATIVMCSAMGQQQMVLEAIQAGAKDFIVKPFDQERIKQAIEKIF